MKNILKYIAASVIALSTVNCTDNFESINTDPNGITDESLTQMNNHIGSKFENMFLNVVNATPAWNYQLQQGLNGDVYSGYMASPTPFAGNINNMTYSLVNGWNGFIWGDSYNVGTIMPSVKDIVDKIAISGDDNGLKFVHLANIIKVTAMHRISDIFGPIRYSKFNDFETTGEYDTQSTAYETFFTELGAAITALKAYENDTQFIPFDKSNFNGNIAEWRKFANTLRLRLALRVSNVNPSLAQTQGELSIASDAGFLTSDVVVNTGFTHPVAIISGSWGDICMSAEMEAILTGYEDNRIEVYFNPALDPALNGNYKGIRMGVDITDKSQYGGHSTVGSVTDTESITWMTVAEGHFLQAEAALRNWSGATDAKMHYNAGVTASFDQHGVKGVGTYLEDATKTPNDFTDALNDANNISYPSDVKIAYDNTSSQEAQLEQIITQKWIAMFPDGQEAWSEFRRTGYPRIFPVVINNSGGTIDTDIQIRRINFVDSEKNTNAENVEKAIGFLTGPDNGGTRLWWDIPGSNF